MTRSLYLSTFFAGDKKIVGLVGGQTLTDMMEVRFVSVAAAAAGVF